MGILPELFKAVPRNSDRLVVEVLLDEPASEPSGMSEEFQKAFAERYAFNETDQPRGEATRQSNGSRSDNEMDHLAQPPADLRPSSRRTGRASARTSNR